MKALFRLFTLLVALHVASPALLATEATNPCTGTPTSFTVAPILTASVQVSGSGCVSFSGSSTAIDGYTEDTDACGKVTRTVNPVGNVSSYYVIVGPDGKTYNSSSVTPNIPGGYTCTYVVYSDKGLSATASASTSVSYGLKSLRKPTLILTRNTPVGGGYLERPITWSLRDIEKIPGDVVFADPKRCLPDLSIPIPFDQVDAPSWSIHGPAHFPDEYRDGWSATLEKPVIAGEYKAGCTVRFNYTVPPPPNYIYGYTAGRSGSAPHFEAGQVDVKSDKKSISITPDLTWIGNLKAIPIGRFGTYDPPGKVSFDVGVELKTICCKGDQVKSYTIKSQDFKVGLGELKLQIPTPWPGLFVIGSIGGAFEGKVSDAVIGCDSNSWCFSGGIKVEGTFGGLGGVPGAIELSVGGFGNASGAGNACYSVVNGTWDTRSSCAGEAGWFVKGKLFNLTLLNAKGTVFSGKLW